MSNGKKDREKNLSLLDEVSQTKHMVGLYKCECGAYQYLRVRVRKKRLSIQLIHFKKRDGKITDQIAKTLAVITRQDLNAHSEKLGVYDPKIQATFTKMIAYADQIREKGVAGWEALIISPRLPKDLDTL